MRREGVLFTGHVLWCFLISSSAMSMFIMHGFAQAFAYDRTVELAFLQLLKPVLISSFSLKTLERCN
jgi:hypothetical protein